MLYACPSCNGPIDAEAQLERAPDAGAWLVCQCLAVLRFEVATDGLTLRVATAAERDGPEAPADIVACLNALKRAHRREARA